MKPYDHGRGAQERRHGVEKDASAGATPAATTIFSDGPEA